jgi:hypothetical protein
MADGLGEERGRSITNLVDEAIKVFEPLARREWLEWGGTTLFGEYQAKLEAEKRVEEERRRREEEEVERQRVAEEKAKRLEERREGLRVARAMLTEEFRAKTLSKEALRERNAVLQAEAKAIEEEEREDEGGKENETEEHEEKRDEGNGDEEVEDLPVIRTRKRKVAKVVEDDEGEEEVDELEEGTTEGDMKRPRLETTGLLVFKGPVSNLSIISNLLTRYIVRQMRHSQSRTAVHCREGCRQVHSMHEKRVGVLVGRGVETRGSTKRPEEVEVGGGEARDASKIRYESLSNRS